MECCIWVAVGSWMGDWGGETYSGFWIACRQGCPVEQSAESKPNKERTTTRTKCYWSHREKETSGGGLPPDTAVAMQQGGHLGSTGEKTGWYTDFMLFVIGYIAALSNLYREIDYKPALTRRMLDWFVSKVGLAHFLPSVTWVNFMFLLWAGVMVRPLLPTLPHCVRCAFTGLFSPPVPDLYHWQPRMPGCKRSLDLAVLTVNIACFLLACILVVERELSGK